MLTPVKFILVFVSVPVLSKQKVFILPAALISWGFRHSTSIFFNLFVAKEIPTIKHRGSPGGNAVNMISQPDSMMYYVV